MTVRAPRFPQGVAEQVTEQSEQKVAHFSGSRKLLQVVCCALALLLLTSAHDECQFVGEAIHSLRQHLLCQGSALKNDL